MPSFDSNWDKKNDLTTYWYQLHPQYWVFQREMSRQPTRLRGWREAAPPSNPHQQGDTPIKIPPVLYIYLCQIMSEKPLTFLLIFIGLSITHIWNSSSY